MNEQQSAVADILKEKLYRELDKFVAHEDKMEYLLKVICALAERVAEREGITRKPN